MKTSLKMVGNFAHFRENGFLFWCNIPHMLRNSLLQNGIPHICIDMELYCVEFSMLHVNAEFYRV